MDNHADGSGIPFERPYFADSSMIRQHLAASYGMRQPPHVLSPHQIPAQQMFPGIGRRPSYPAPDEDQRLGTSKRSNPLQSPTSLAPLGTSATSPWMMPFSQPNVLNPEFSMTSMYPSRWAQEQTAMMSSQQRDSHLFASQFRQESTMQAIHQREVQLQRDRELHFQRQQEAQLQREQKQKEQELQLQRERETRLQMERQHEALLQRKREAQLQQERDMQFQRQRQEQLEREGKEQAQRELLYLHQANQFQHLSNNSPQDHRTPMMHFNFQQDMSSIPNHSSVPSIPNFSHPTSDVAKSIANMPYSMPALNKEATVNTSQIHFPQSSSTGVSINEQQMNMSYSLPLSSMSSLVKRNPSLEDNLLPFDQSFREHGFYDQAGGTFRNLEDIDLTIDRHISAIKLDSQRKELSTDTSYSSSKASRPSPHHRFSDVLNDQRCKIENIHMFQGKESTTQDPTLNFNSFSINQITDTSKVNGSNSTPTTEMSTLKTEMLTPQQLPNAHTQQQQQKPIFTPQIQSIDSTPVSFSQSNTVQVTQSSSVNINININMPSHPSFPFGLSDLSSTPSSTALKGPTFVNEETKLAQTPIHNSESDKKNQGNFTQSWKLQNSTNVASENNIASEEVFISKDNKNQSTDSSAIVSTAVTTIVHSRQKSKQSFSSIETFLGISSSSSTSTTVINESAVPASSSLELARTAIECRDRISVIKPVAAAQEEQGVKDAAKEVENNTSSPRLFDALSAHDTEAIEKSTTVARPVHPSMRFKKSHKVEQAKESVERKLDSRPIHPSMRLKFTAATTKSSIEIKDADNCLSVKPVRYQSEAIDVASKNNGKDGKNPTRGKPANFLVSGGKPVDFSSYSGKPANFSQSPAVKRKSTPPTGGKPLSYFKSICDNKSEFKTVNKEKKTTRSKKESQEQLLKRKQVLKREEKKVVAEDNEKVVLPSLPPQAVILQQNKVKPEEKGSPVLKKQKVVHGNAISSGKPFQFKNITFDAETEKESSDSDSESSDDDDDDDETKDSDKELSSNSESEDDLDTTLDSAVSQDSDIVIGKKRKTTSSNNEIIAALKKRKVVDEEVIKVPLEFGWRRQTRLRPVSTGESLRGDVYYYSPCGKKLRTYPEINNYMLQNPNVDVQLENFSFSTKLRVGDFLEAKQGSKFEPLSDEQVNERFDAISEKNRLSLEKAAIKKKEKDLQLQKSKKIQQERQHKKLEKQMLKKQREEERRRAIQEKALEAKQKKEKEREAALQSKRMKEEERMRMKESREKERLQKLEQQRLEKEWKQQALENEREKRRQEMVINKAQEKEQRRREIIMMRAYEAQKKAEEKERLKEQRRLEKTIMKQRKIEQKRYEKLISRELKKPIDDMALNDLKPLPLLPSVVNLNISGQAYADLLMVQEFVHSFGHVIDINVEEDFPSLADLQVSLLCESSNEDALFNACQQLLFYALYDPGISGKYASTALGTNLQNVDLNETNISEVLRLFMLCRNEGENTKLSSLLVHKPLVSLSPTDKAAALAFLCNELLCGKAIGREIEGSLENMSNLRRDKWTLEGQMRKLKVDISKKKPKSNNGLEKKLVKQNLNSSQGSQDEESRADDKESDEDSDDDEPGQDFCVNQNDEDVDGEFDTDDPQNLEQMEKKLKQMEKKHARFRSKLCDSSHTIRGVHLGQDRYKRRYFVLPNAGGVYVEGLESGFFDEEMCQKTQLEKEQTKEKLGTLLTTLKSPNVISPPSIKIENKDTSSSTRENASVFSTSDTQTEKLSSSSSNISSEQLDVEIKQEHTKQNVSLVSKNINPGIEPLKTHGIYSKSVKLPEKWFSLRTKGKCDEPKPSQSKNDVPPKPYHKSMDIVPPKLKTLSEDHMFLESIYKYYSYTDGADTNKNDVLKLSAYSHPANLNSCPGNVSSLFGLPPDLDINLLIQQDPQKAAELLEIQTAVPQEIPSDMKHGWWRIIDPDLLQCVTKAAHLRGMRERSLQKAVARYNDYAVKSCKASEPKFSLEFPEDDVIEGKEDVKSSVVRSTGPVVDQWFQALAYASDKAVLIEIEELEEKVFSASLQMKGYRLSQKMSTNLQLDMSKEYKPDDENHPLHLAAAKLLALEAGIERRYLKHPFRLEKLTKSEAIDVNKDENLKNSNIQTITPALRLWREAVTEATSAAQLTMCVNRLLECIAWDKSIMKVFCILCRKSDNEERLLLCDACDRGCHTYCCKPKLETIPDGDWFCQECVLMASGSDQCYVCEGKSGRRQKCGYCPRHYHLQCLDPPLQKTPRSPWACPVCKKARLKTKPQPKKYPRVEELARKEEVAKSKSPNNRQQVYKDMEPCRHMLTELENHELAWPFLVPVNGKQFPEYYQVIRHPMDFHTMKTKLRDYAYKSRDEFAHDARRVFINCNTFNEDDSEVGQAGKSMSRYFESRWPEILKNAANKRTYEKQEKQLNSSMDKADDDSSGDEESSSGDEVSSESESSEVEESDDEATMKAP